ncbi:MAG: hypothetical protein PHO93_04920, partial [Candidatus Saccharimonadaceae bacterium]|nr:hypothetical protein [Candidatus Saccharimonadaceae bacterium]
MVWVQGSAGDKPTRYTGQTANVAARLIERATPAKTDCWRRRGSGLLFVFFNKRFEFRRLVQIAYEMTVIGF